MATSTIPRDFSVISPDVLGDFALKHGWNRVGGHSQTANVYASNDGFWVSVPIRTDFADYDLRVEQYIDTFAQATGLDTHAIYDRLVLNDWDVVRFRAVGSDKPYVDYSAGRKLVEGSEKAMVAAACSLFDSSGVYSDSVKTKARKLVDRMKLDQTERGSFVVKVLIPPGQRPFDALNDQLKQGLLSQDSVSRRLASALSSTRHLLSDRGDEDVAEVVTSGGSTELCDALAAMVEPFESIETQFEWAADADDAPQFKPTTFHASDYERLKSTSKKIRSATSDKTDIRRITAFVRELHRTKQAASVGGDGTIELEWRENGKIFTAKCEMNDSDYATAVEAHSSKAPITVEGRLAGAGKTLRINEVALVNAGKQDDGPDVPLPGL